jgi:protein SCO1/2
MKTDLPIEKTTNRFKKIFPCLLLFTAACHQGPTPLPHLGKLTDFSLPMVTSQEQRVLKTQDLLGRVWIANFIFTHCSGPCPRLSRQMEKLQTELPPAIGLLTFSIDPERDTPDVLTTYAQRYNADPLRWFFVTGKKADLYALYENGFKVVAAEDKALPLEERFVHSTMVVLLDQNGAIRGYYDGEQQDALFRLKRDATGLLLPETKANQ